MPTTFKQLAAACGLALLLPAGASAACSAATHWPDLGPPSFGSLRDLPEAAAALSDCAALALPGARDLDIHLSDLSLYVGVRFLTWDALPAPISLARAAMRGDDDLVAPAADTRRRDADDDEPTFGPESLAMFLAGFLGIVLVALRRRRP